MSDLQLCEQPAFCPVCGASFTNYRYTRRHLHVQHGLEGRQSFPALRVVWREVTCALLGIVDPAWDGP